MKTEIRRCPGAFDFSRALVSDGSPPRAGSRAESVPQTSNLASSQQRVRSPGQVLHLRHHPPLARPALALSVAEFLELPHRLPAGPLQLPDDVHPGLDPPLQPIVFRQSQDVIDPFRFVPRHQLVIRESAVSPNRDPHLGPSLPQPPHDPLQLRHHPVGGASIRRAESRTQQMIATEDVRRQMTVALLGGCPRIDYFQKVLFVNY